MLARPNQLILGSALLLVRLAGSGTASASPPPVEYPMPSPVVDVATADFDENAKPDVIAVHGNVSVLLSSPTGLTAPIGVPGVFGAQSAAVADFDGDGHLDLAAGSSAGLTVKLGVGNGTFETPASTSLSGQFQFLATGDFDQDTDPDIAAATYGSGETKVLLGEGDGTFSAPSTYSLGLTGVGNFPSINAISVGRLDPGSTDDVVVTDNNNRIFALYGNGSGSLGTAHQIPAPGNPSATELADIDGDGATDLIATLREHNEVGVALNEGAGDFSEFSSVPTDHGPAGLAIADFGGDGDLDAATGARSEMSSVSIHTGDGTGFLSRPASSRASGRVLALSATDLDGDQDVDLIAGTENADAVSVYYNDGGIDTGARPVAIVTPFIDGFPPVLTGTVVSWGVYVQMPAGGDLLNLSWDFESDGTVDRVTGPHPTLEGGQVYVSIQAPAVTPGYTLLRVTANTTTGSYTGVSGNQFEVRPAPPSGPLGVTINDGAQFTNNPAVTVKAVWPAFETTITVSNDGGFGSATSMPLKASLPWTLDSSGPERLPKTIYVRFSGGSSAPTTLTDDIILDQTPPTVTSAVAGGQASGSTAAIAGRRITVRASDATSGVASIQVARKKSTPLAWRSFARRISAPRGRLWVRVSDAAGNVSSWRQVRQPK